MTIYNLPFPPGFQAKDFVEPCAQPSGDGSWFFVGYGSFPGEPVLCHVFQARGNGTEAIRVLIERPTKGRGSLAIGGLGKGLWLLSYEGPALIQQSVPGWTPPPWVVY
jgi:hypothetical protein